MLDTDFPLYRLSIFNNSWLEPFPMLITDLTKGRWKEIQVGMEEVNFKGHVASQCLVRPQQILHQTLESQKAYTNAYILSNLKVLWQFVQHELGPKIDLYPKIYYTSRNIDCKPSQVEVFYFSAEIL